ncbi:uncharacterized protein LOC130746842 [Lotus japonicus]|uniref:uncharacterized protein LOC130746842 n=1 Tax=Lotus japonicus TaxID=34305 RepID=UPI002588FDE2|nr:uncharacterized protein LOC130746842 [Lotus japonicus]
MAKNNKYASINFNHIYEKSITTKNTTTTTNPSKNPSLAPSSSYASASYSAVSAPNKPHGRILVLTRPTPKPVTHPTTPAPPQPQPPSQPSPIQRAPDHPRPEPGSDAISLRPLGRTGSGPSLAVPNQEKDRELPSPRQPLKPNKFVPPHLRPGYVPKEDPGRFGENGRPKSGGLERMRRGGGSDVGRGVRPSSSG